MRSHVEDKSCRRSWIWGQAITLLALALPLPASAALGASKDSVQDDQLRLQAKVRVTAALAYEVHEMTAPTGTIVREYVSPDGRVFAVAWRGPFVPDMKQLLGRYFEQYSRAARRQRQQHIGRSFLNIQEHGLVVQTAGHMRAYSGRAYAPELLPAGVGATDVR